MVKKVFGFLCLITFLFACKTKESKPVASPADPIAELRASIAQYPDSLLLQEQLIQLYRENGAYDSAILITNNVLAKDSNVARFWYIKGTLELENEDTTHAVSSLEYANSLHPTIQNLTMLGNMYALQKNNRALDVANLLTKDASDEANTAAWFMQGIYYSNIYQYDKAISYFDKCIALSYTNTRAYLEKGIAQLALHQNKDALTTFTRAVTVQNNFEEGYFYQGKTWELLGKNDEAINAYQTALIYDKNYTEAQEALKRLTSK